MSPPLRRAAPFLASDDPAVLGQPSDDLAIRSLQLRQATASCAEPQDAVGLTILCGSSSPASPGASHTRAETALIARVFLHAPGESVHTGIRGDCGALQMRLARATFERILLEDHHDASGLSALAPLQGQQDYELLTLLARALLLPAAHRPLAVRRVVGRLATQHGTRARRHHARGIGPARLKRVMSLVASELGRVTLDAMASEAGLSVFHFAREFRHETGQTPWTLVTRCRVWEAVRLLSTSGATVQEVADRVGFAHARHLARAFHQQLGAPPSVVRRHLVF